MYLTDATHIFGNHARVAHQNKVMIKALCDRSPGTPYWNVTSRQQKLAPATRTAPARWGTWQEIVMTGISHPDDYSFDVPAVVPVCVGALVLLVMRLKVVMRTQANDQLQWAGPLAVEAGTRATVVGVEVQNEWRPPSERGGIAEVVACAEAQPGAGALGAAGMPVAVTHGGFAPAIGVGEVVFVTLNVPGRGLIRVRQQTISHHNDMTTRRSAFPFVLAYAFTVGRVQGLEFDSVVVHMDSFWITVTSQTYVAISRAKNPARLLVVGEGTKYNVFEGMRRQLNNVHPGDRDFVARAERAHSSCGALENSLRFMTPAHALAAVRALTTGAPINLTVKLLSDARPVAHIDGCGSPATRLNSSELSDEDAMLAALEIEGEMQSVSESAAVSMPAAVECCVVLSSSASASTSVVPDHTSPLSAVNSDELARVLIDAQSALVAAVAETASTWRPTALRGNSPTDHDEDSASGRELASPCVAEDAADSSPALDGRDIAMMECDEVADDAAALGAWDCLE